MNTGRKLEIELLAADIINRNKLLHNFDLVKFLEASEGFRVLTSPFKAPDLQSIALVTTDDILSDNYDKKVIISTENNSNKPWMFYWRYQRRYIIAREYAYYKLYGESRPMYIHRSFKFDFSKKRREAAYFTRCLLVQRAQLFDIAQHDPSVCGYNKDTITYLANYFVVPESIIKKRINDIYKDIKKAVK